MNSALIVEVREACYKLAESQSPDGKQALRDIADGLWPVSDPPQPSAAESALIPAEEPEPEIWAGADAILI